MSDLELISFHDCRVSLIYTRSPHHRNSSKTILNLFNPDLSDVDSLVVIGEPIRHAATSGSAGSSTRNSVPRHLRKVGWCLKIVTIPTGYR